MLVAMLLGAVIAQPVWGGVTSATTHEEVNKLFPDKYGDAVPGCPATVFASYKNSIVTMLHVQHRGKFEGCRAKVLADLIARYGQPDVSNDERPNVFYPNEKKIVIYKWRSGALAIEMSGYVSRSFSYDIEYAFKK